MNINSDFQITTWTVMLVMKITSSLENPNLEFQINTQCKLILINNVYYAYKLISWSRVLLHSVSWSINSLPFMELEGSLLCFARALQSLCLVRITNIKFIYQLRRLVSFLEAESQSARPDILNFLWNPRIYYSAHKNLTWGSMLTQMNPVHILTLHFFQIHLNYNSFIYA